MNQISVEHFTYGMNFFDLHVITGIATDMNHTLIASGNDVYFAGDNSTTAAQKHGKLHRNLSICHFSLNASIDFANFDAIEITRFYLTYI